MQAVPKGLRVQRRRPEASPGRLYGHLDSQGLRVLPEGNPNTAYTLRRFAGAARRERLPLREMIGESVCQRESGVSRSF